MEGSARTGAHSAEHQAPAERVQGVQHLSDGLGKGADNLRYGCRLASDAQQVIDEAWLSLGRVRNMMRELRRGGVKIERHPEVALRIAEGLGAAYEGVVRVYAAMLGLGGATFERTGKTLTPEDEWVAGSVEEFLGLARESGARVDELS